MRNLAPSLAALAVLAAVVSGCLPTSRTTVRGRVVYNDKPVTGATVTFGPTMGEVSAVTGADGKFELTASHRPTAMLRLAAAKEGMVQREKAEFPGFAAPDPEIEVEMIGVIAPKRR